MATIDKVRRDLKQLDPEQLQAVADFIDLLLARDEEPEPGDQDQESQDQESQDQDQGGGYVEWKYIRGYGPYAYWRYWDKGHLRSKYLGKDLSKARSPSS